MKLKEVSRIVFPDHRGCIGSFIIVPDDEDVYQDVDNFIKKKLVNSKSDLLMMEEVVEHG